jgi:hypothetical protein
VIENPIVAAFIYSAAVPAVLVAAGVVMVGRMGEPWRTRLQGLIFASGFAGGAYYLLSRLSFPPSDAGEAFIWAAALLSAFVVISPAGQGRRYMLRALFVLALGALLLWPLRQTVFSPVNYRNLVAFFCLGLGVWSITEQSSGKVKPLSFFALPLIALGSLSVFMLLRSSASLSQLVAIPAAICGGLAAVSLVFPAMISRYAFVPFLSVFVVLLITAAQFYLDVNPWHLIYLCLPFLVLWVRDWLVFIPRSQIGEALGLGLLAGAPLAWFLYSLSVNSGPLY